MLITNIILSLKIDEEKNFKYYFLMLCSQIWWLARLFLKARFLTFKIDECEGRSAIHLISIVPCQ